MPSLLLYPIRENNFEKNPNLTTTLMSPIENMKIAVSSTLLYTWSLRGELFW
jgi:hypothetical protein